MSLDDTGNPVVCLGTTEVQMNLLISALVACCQDRKIPLVSISENFMTG